jgi:hypothetical protein
MKRQRIDIEDDRAEKGGAPLPAVLIDGANFFSGDYKGRTGGRTGKSGVISMTDDNWRQMWRSLGQQAPGPLPEGAVAVMNVAHDPEDPSEHLPLRIRHDGRNARIDWEWRHMATAEQTPAVSRYAVLILPRGLVSQTYHPTSAKDEAARASEKKEMQEADRAVITDGLKKPVRVMPRIQLRPKPPRP